jgi:hypothetical protein
MLVLAKLRGKMSKRGVSFEGRTWKLYQGSLAHAESGGQKPPANEVVPTGPWGPQIPMINQLFQQAAGLYAGGPPKYYPGSTVAQTPELIGQTQNAAVNQVNQNIPQNQQVAGTAATSANNAYNNAVASTAQNLTPNLQQSLMALFGGAPSSGLNQAGQAVLPAVTGAIQGATSGSAPQYQTPGAASGNLDINQQLQQSLDGTAMSPYLDQVIQGALRSSTNQFNRSVLPGINDGASAAGQVGGSRHGIAQGIAAGDLANAQTDMVGRIYQGAFDQASQDRTNALGLISGMQGQNLQAQLQTNQLNEALRSGLVGESLQGAGLGASLLGQGSTLQQQGLLGAGQLGANLLTQGQALGTDQLTRSAALLPMLQGANLQGLDFANQMGLQQYGFGQAQTDADVERWFFDQFAPYNALTQFQNYISGPYGSSVAGGAGQQTNQTTGQLMPQTQKPGGGRLGPGSLLFGPGLNFNADQALQPWKFF